MPRARGLRKKGAQEAIDNGDGTSVIAGWFDSAWAPPIEAYNTFLDDMDGCYSEATYEEGGMDFAGIYPNPAHKSPGHGPEQTPST